MDLVPTFSLSGGGCPSESDQWMVYTEPRKLRPVSTGRGTGRTLYHTVSVVWTVESSNEVPGMVLVFHRPEWNRVPRFHTPTLVGS